MRDPDQSGLCAKAWIIDPEKYAAGDPRLNVFVGGWLIKGEKPDPEDTRKVAEATLKAIGLSPAMVGLDRIPPPASVFHPIWDTWLLQSCSLKEEPGVDPPKLHYPEAEFEIMILSGDPTHGPYDPDDMRRFRFLEPPDLAKQVHNVTAEQVRQLMGSMVRAICAGLMSPDSDYRSRWEGSIDHTLEHYRAGIHDPQ